MHRTTRKHLLILTFLMLLASIANPGYGRRGSSGRERGQLDESAYADAIKTLDELTTKVREGAQVDKEQVDALASKLYQTAWSKDPDELLEKLNVLQKDRGQLNYPSKAARLSDKAPLARLIVMLECRKQASAPPEQVQAHPSAAEFPGQVPAAADRAGVSIVVDTEKPGWHNYGIYGNPRSPYWHSTGLYAAPGEVVTVKVPEQFIDKGLSVRIGAHSDKLWRTNSWARFPDICRTFPIEATKTSAANAFGGLVYIESPHDLKAGQATVRITGGVKAPYFVLGKTSARKWRARIRDYPAPWAELQGEKVILTLPSNVVRDINDPTELMEFWDGIMDHYADLLGRDPQRRRIERFVSDIQISAGYMHSGYPLMTMLDICETMVDKDRIIANGHGGVWGLFHEIGHNHQNSDWTFRGTTEVTVNVFSLYIMEKACGLVSAGHGSITPQARQKNTASHLADGARFEKWQQSPFLALIMYMQLKEQFGWEPLTKTFAQYRELTDEQRPASDDAKRDQWMVRLSKTIGRDLGPFFQTWGVPTSQQARDSIADLPEWMPDGFPPKTDSKE